MIQITINPPLWNFAESGINTSEMSYEIILLEETVNIMHITCASFKKWKLWRVQFHDGKEAVLYKCENEWTKRIEDRLDFRFLLLIGKCIDNTFQTKIRPPD